MKRTEDMGTWRAAALFFVVVCSYLALLAGVLLLAASLLGGAHWALAIPVFGVAAIGCTVGFWFGLRRAARTSRPTVEKWLRILVPLVVAPFAILLMIGAFARGDVFSLVLGAYMALVLLDIVTNIVLRFTIHRELSAALIIGRLVRAVWRKATENVGV